MLSTAIPRDTGRMIEVPVRSAKPANPHEAKGAEQRQHVGRDAQQREFPGPQQQADEKEEALLQTGQYRVQGS